MTMRRTSRRTRNPVRRVFTSGQGSSTTIGGTMTDSTPVSELSATADSQFGDILVTGLALIDLADEGAIHQCILWVGRTSTEPAVTDTGVRTRQYAANAQGLPFVLRFRGLKVNPGQLMKVLTKPLVETNAALVHQELVSIKWSFRELRQG